MNNNMQTFETLTVRKWWPTAEPKWSQRTSPEAEFSCLLSNRILGFFHLSEAPIWERSPRESPLPHLRQHVGCRSHLGNQVCELRSAWKRLAGQICSPLSHQRLASGIAVRLIYYSGKQITWRLQWRVQWEYDWSDIEYGSKTIQATIWEKKKKTEFSLQTRWIVEPKNIKDSFTIETHSNPTRPSGVLADHCPSNHPLGLGKQVLRLPLCRGRWVL